MKQRRFFACMMALLLVCSLPVSAFADTWYLEDGDIAVNATESGQTVSQGTQVNVPDSAPVITQSNSSTPTTNTITITATENATANVTIQDVNIVISDTPSVDYSGKAAVTIDVADNASANVTLNSVDIDTTRTFGKGDASSDGYGAAAIQITGNGDVTMELDGENTVQSGATRAGVEKNTIAATSTDPGNGNGNLTITDENGTAGSLESTGGISGSGIGSGREGDGSNITITGSAEVTAKGSLFGSGIGGGNGGSGSNITITGSAEVTAQGGYAASGIGGGHGGSGSNITVSEDAQVKAQGGEASSISGAGAAIGNGGTRSVDVAWTPIDGNEVSPITDALNEGWIATYAPGTENMNTATPDSLTYKGASNVAGAQPIAKQEPTCTEDGHRAGFTVNGTQVGGQTLSATGHSFTNYISNNDGSKTAKCDHCDATHTIPAPVSEPVPEEVPQTAPLYRVIGQDGKALAFEKQQKGGVLTITVEADFATLTGSFSGMKTLKAQGVDTIVFVTNGATSTFAIADLLAQGSSTDTYALTHVGSTVTLTLGNGIDISSILK